MMALAPTSIAAIDAGGMTINSFFQIPFGLLLSNNFENSESHYSPENFERFSRAMRAKGRRRF
ncbi:hypothetical protein HYN43_002715 [Mucilaginibacter celer]|uniref:Uncharacterized protein n=1 Tax=Mucilaginibacter celer TaxID=2305508 RepID=A0A494VL66_9SPHI|nr:hypothetical protein HYN43_002715 [Mucilaginibacter celer]